MISGRKMKALKGFSNLRDAPELQAISRVLFEIEIIGDLELLPFPRDRAVNINFFYLNSSNIFLLSLKHISVSHEYTLYIFLT